MMDSEVWISVRPVTFMGDIVEWNQVKVHRVRFGRTLCGKPVGGDRWERATGGQRVDCKLCLKKES